MLLRLILIGFLSVLSGNVYPQVGLPKTITIKAGDTQALIDAINTANADTSAGGYYIDVETGPNGETGFVFTGAYDSTNNALPTITRSVTIRNYLDNNKTQNVTFTGSGDRDFRLLKVTGGRFELWDASVRDFGVNGESGGAILATGTTFLECRDCRFENNFSDMNGGAIACNSNTQLWLTGSELVGNRSSNLGGAISVEGNCDALIGTGESKYGQGNVFRDNIAGVFGCDLNVQTSNEVRLVGNVFDSANCQNVLVENPFGTMVARYNTFAHAGDGIDSTGVAQLLGNIFQGPASSNQLNALSPASPKPQAACNDFGSGAFDSKGHNISTDASCSLDQVTDQPNTDPMLSFNQNGLPVLSPGSPAIDAGSDAIVVPDDQGLAVLPCGYQDINGVARPQDGNNSGHYECDTGASEFLGTGSMQAGHSGAFYNALRNGEGNYVEVLTDDVAVVYTFTFRPDGSGPSWFIGVGDIRDNSIVIEDLLRPTGTSFGSGFDPAAIDYSDAGGMSMVFPTCDAAGGGGGVAYSGNPELGYEGVLSRAQRITSITGCNNTPTANAGLSGSFYDPARNGEGLIIEWLTNGDVVAIFFTYDQNGDQFWTFGIGTPNGKSVTIDAIYPAASTVWGRNFNPADVDLQSWGTFSLTWTACDTLDFDYNSTVPGYGSGSYDYTRVSTLQSTSCPSF